MLTHTLFTAACIALSAIGTSQAVFGAVLARNFISRSRHETQALSAPAVLPPVTVLKPLHGDEPLLDRALESFCTQSYPCFQIIFGVHRANDTAISVVQRLRKSHPKCDIQLIIDDAIHGVNHKVSNLINMYPYARHDIIVMADSDIHASKDYLHTLVALLSQNGTGLVTTLYAGLPASKALVRRFGAAQINQFFMPGVLLSRKLGRKDCLGATMALRRETLEGIGGLQALVGHVADDAVLGHKVLDSGLHVALAPCLTETTVTETKLADIFSHELRWGRTIKNLEPLGYALSSTQLSLFWALLAIVFSGGNFGVAAFFVVSWALRGFAASLIDCALRRPDAFLWALLPIRDLFSVAVILCSLRGKRVAWRGQHLRVDRHVRATPERSKRAKRGNRVV